MSVHVKNLSYSYPGRSLFKNLHIDFMPSGLTLIRGPSGCGKSTFLQLIAGLKKIESGKILLDTSRIGYIHQDCHLIDHWSLSENFSLVCKDIKQQQTEMKFFDLIVPLSQKVHLLSGGEKQRASLIRLILQKPELILLDEPTANLDDDHTASAMQRIKKEFSKKTTLVVSHDQRLTQFADVIFDWKKEVRL